MIEVWKDIPGYEGRYQASREGQIRRVYPSGKTRLLTPYHHKMHGSQRLIVHLTDKNGKGKQVVVLGLIASMFLGRCPEGCVPYHINGSQYENHVNNIAYIDRRELGRLTGSRSKRRSVFKLDANGEVVDVYSSAREAGRKNYMSDQTIIDRCNGKVKSAFAPDGYAYAWEDSAKSMKQALEKIERARNSEKSMSPRVP